ncbi:MAG: hypothetical protein Q4F34_00345 [Prevotellaceae bacterium]|nr:hypothetical protein [Prevotellaceae bacterium]
MKQILPILLCIILVAVSCKSDDDIYNIEISDATEITAFSANVTVHVTDALKRDGTSFGVIYSTDEVNLLKGESVGSETMVSTKTFTITGLQPSTTYYYIGVARISGLSYATNTVKSFTTKAY